MQRHYYISDSLNELDRAERALEDAGIATQLQVERALRAEGVSDTEILEAVQATACFAYWVRFINALGVQLGSETIGMYDNLPAQES